MRIDNELRGVGVSCLLAVSLLPSVDCSTYDFYAPMECLTGSVSYDTTGASRQLNAASVAMQCDRDPTVNRQKMQDFVVRIVDGHPEVDLIVFGEMSLGWYDDSDDQAAYQSGLAESIPGPTTEMVSDLAARYGVYITFGMVQDSGGVLYNAQPVIGPDGSLLAVHHKTTMTPADEAAGFVPGDGLTVVDIGGVTTGVVLCKDQENSLLTKEVVDEGCELVVLSLADDVVEDIADCGSDTSRKYEAWLVTSNRYGPEGDVTYQGEIRVSDPGGNTRIGREGAEQYLYYTIPLFE